MKTQNQLILEHLQKGCTITQKMAYRAPFYCTRLSARICDLRGDNHNILSDTIKYSCKRTGRTVRYARYFMEV